MTARVYATPTDFYEFVGEEPPAVEDAELEARLRRASVEVDGQTRRAVYDTDEGGYPTDERISDALRDAACAWAAYWAETDDPTGADAMRGPVKILSVSLGGTATGGASSRTVSEVRRADEAVTILRNAGLMPSSTAHT